MILFFFLSLQNRWTYNEIRHEPRTDEPKEMTKLLTSIYMGRFPTQYSGRSPTQYLGRSPTQRLDIYYSDFYPINISQQSRPLDVFTLLILSMVIFFPFYLHRTDGTYTWTHELMNSWTHELNKIVPFKYIWADPQLNGSIPNSAD